MKTAVLTVSLILVGCAGKNETRQVRIARIGTGLQMCCLPVPLAQALGYYKDEGLEVVTESFPSGAKTLQTMVGGSADVAIANYSSTLQVAAEGQRVRSFVVMNRRALNVLVVAPAASEKIKRAEDLKGGLIGVSSPGSATHQFANYYLAAHGIRPTEFSAVGIGLGPSALAAIESGRVDAASMAGGDHLYLLKLHPGLRILVDASTPEGVRDGYGGDAFAGGTMSAKPEWLDRNPDTARRLARALRRTLQWISTHTAEEIRERLPEGFRSPDAAVDLEIIRWGVAGYTTDGMMPAGAPEVMKRFLNATVDKVRDSKIDLAATWTNEFLSGVK